MGYVYNPLLGAGFDQTGGSTSPGGSTTQLQFNSAGSFGGISTLTYDGSILTTSGRFINSYNATASGPAKAFTGTWFTGGTGTTTKPHVLIEPTGTTSTAWSTSGTGFGVNAASGFTGNLLDLQVNGTSQFRVEAGSGNVGTVYVDRLQAITTSGAGSYLRFFNSANKYQFEAVAAGSTFLTYDQGLAALGFGATQTVSWGTGSIVLARDANNTLAQRNGTNAQVSRIYNTYTDASNYERLSTTWTSNVCYTKPENAGTGAARLYVPVTGSTTVASLPAASTAGVGARSFVTDATATTFLSTVAGGGANKVPVVSDGTNWLIG